MRPQASATGSPRKAALVSFRILDAVGSGGAVVGTA
jgi:hypothetical protein